MNTGILLVLVRMSLQAETSQRIGKPLRGFINAHSGANIINCRATMTKAMWPTLIYNTSLYVTWKWWTRRNHLSKFWTRMNMPLATTMANLNRIWSRLENRSRMTIKASQTQCLWGHFSWIHLNFCTFKFSRQASYTHQYLSYSRLLFHSIIISESYIPSFFLSTLQFLRPQLNI